MNKMIIQIKKGTLLNVNHSRSGNWVGIATEDFDTEKDEWYPIALAQEQIVKGMRTYWTKGDSMPARRGLCKVEIKEMEE